jgi:hypothetical protein
MAHRMAHRGAIESTHAAPKQEGGEGFGRLRAEVSALVDQHPRWRSATLEIVGDDVGIGALGIHHQRVQARAAAAAAAAVRRSEESM